MQRTSSRKLGLVTALGAVVVLIGGLIAVSGASAQGPAVSVGSLTTGVGQHTGVSLQAHSIPALGLGAWTIDIAYNPDAVTVVECRPKQGGICNPAYSANKVRVVGTSVFGLPGESKLATITFACKSAGSSALSVTWTVLADATLGGPRPIEATAENGKATCTQEPKATPTHEPKATPPAGPVAKLGDVNCDRIVNAIDATFVLQRTAGILRSLPCPENDDLNHDGLSNSLDAALILQMEAGLL